MISGIKPYFYRIAAGVMFLAAGVGYCFSPDITAKTEQYEIRTEKAADSQEEKAGQTTGLQEEKAGQTTGLQEEKAGRTTGLQEEKEGQAADIININTATESELTALPGIGNRKAAAIVAYRSKNGSFSSTEELMRVPGIKEATFNKLKDLICCE